jgi:hypothetical protein
VLVLAMPLGPFSTTKGHTGRTRHDLFLEPRSKNLLAEDPVLGLRWPKSSEQHGKHKHRRGPSTPRLASAVTRDKSVTRSAQDDGIVEVLAKNVLVMRRLPGLRVTRSAC